MRGACVSALESTWFLFRLVFGGLLHIPTKDILLPGSTRINSAEKPDGSSSHPAHATIMTRRDACKDAPQKSGSLRQALSWRGQHPDLPDPSGRSNNASSGSPQDGI